MAQVRKLYRNGKVWADADESGALVVDARGLVQIRYRREDATSYSAKERELRDLPPEMAVAAARAAAAGSERASDAASGAGADAAAAPAAKKKRAARPRAAAKPRAKKGGAGGAPTAAGSGADGREVLVIYADGSCFGNPGPAGIGVLLEWKGQSKEISRFLGDGTNNIAELTAIEAGLEAVKNRDVPVRLHTDSQYAIGVLSEGWKAKENRPLIARVQALMAHFPDLKLVKVRGHSGDPRNEKVDQLARDAITFRR